MKEIEQVVKRYLKENDTDYAIMITGKWGCGKTYFVKHTLINSIKTVPYITMAGKTEYYDAVYISLYGLSGIEELPYLVLKNIYPIIDGKFAAVAKGVVGGFADRLGVGKDNAQHLLKLIDIKKDKVLIFDDLERINFEKVHIKEVLGAINQYVESGGIKTIFISDENRIGDDYKDFKEKTIRYTIQFQRSFEESFDIIVSELKDDDYKEFIKDQKPLILKVFQKGECDNLRTFRFIVDAFKEIFDRVDNSKYKFEILSSLLVSFLIYTIEYKSGKSPDELIELSKLNIYMGFLNDNKDKQKEYIDILYDKYADIRHEYNYYHVINEYISKGYIEDNALNVIVKELYEECYRNAETPEGALLKKFIYWDSIEDDKFSDYIKEMLQYVNNNSYSIRDLTTLYYQLLKLEYFDIENFKVDASIDEIFKNAANCKEHNDGFNLYIESSFYRNDPQLYGDELDKRYIAYKQYIGKVNQELRAESEQRIINNFLSVLESGDGDKIIENGKNSDLKFLFENLEANKVFDILKNSDRDVVEAFRYVVYCKYPDGVRGLDVSEKERTFINTLKSLINDYLNQLKVKRLSTVWFQLLNRKLDTI